MSIRVDCKSCGKTLTAPDRAAGKRARCPKCQTILVLPMLEPESDDDFELDLSHLNDATDTEASAYSYSSMHPAARSGATSGNRIETAPPQIGDQTSLPSWSPKLRRWGYLVFILALLPLAGSLLSDDSDDEARIMNEVMKYESQIDQLTESSSEDDFFAIFPENRIEGAHLAHGSMTHWVYAFFAAALFFGAAMLLFDPGEAKLLNLVWCAVFTGTAGILILLGFQLVAEWTQSFIVVGRSILVILFWIVKFIGFSYSAASDPDNGFWLSAIGFTCGVGLCEELIKALPVAWRANREPWLDWRGACIWGLISGVGFGVAEGIMYSADYYNGIHTADIYVVRFISCVGLHAVWGASVGLSIMLVLQKETPSDVGSWLFIILRAMFLPMVLHGLYDTMLKQDMNGQALAVALLSFGWLAYLIERSIRRDLADARLGRVMVT